MARQYLSSILFMFLLVLACGHISCARDMNEPGPPEPKETNQTPTLWETFKNYIAGYGSTQVSKESDKPYLTSSGNSQDSIPYIASYNKRKHIHPFYQPGSATDDTNQPGSDETYQTGYPSQDSNQPGSDETYLTAYPSQDSNQPGSDTYAPYLSVYGTKKDTHPTDKSEANQPNYITGYRTNHPTDKLEADQPKYITGYRTNHPLDKLEADQPNYITGYRTNHPLDKSEANQPNYITAYRTNHPSDISEANQDYGAQYGRKGEREANHDQSYQGYAAAYGNKGEREANQDQSYQGYAAAYGNRGEREAKHDQSYQGYAAAYGHRGEREANQDQSYQGYAAAYGNRGEREAKGEREDSQKSSITSYAIQSKEKPSSHMDHSEAFKTGFFTLDDMYIGNTMTLRFPISKFGHFLTQKEADSIPFSMSQLPSILQLFSVPKHSSQAQAMRGTLEQCESPLVTGETRACVTSLESMIDFARSIVGPKTHLEIHATNWLTMSSAGFQKYTILEISKDIYAPKWVACHPLPYPHAVYFCHFINTGSKIFKVSLRSESGEKLEALGLCHLDTSDWTPGHILLKQLGIKPGEAPVCHFLPVKHLVWVPSATKATA